jgi:hypothetical protein
MQLSNVWTAMLKDYKKKTVAWQRFKKEIFKNRWG